MGRRANTGHAAGHQSPAAVVLKAIDREHSQLFYRSSHQLPRDSARENAPMPRFDTLRTLLRSLDRGWAKHRALGTLETIKWQVQVRSNRELTELSRPATRPNRTQAPRACATDYGRPISPALAAPLVASYSEIDHVDYRHVRFWDRTTPKCATCGLVGKDAGKYGKVLWESLTGARRVVDANRNAAEADQRKTHSHPVIVVGVDGDAGL